MTLNAQPQPDCLGIPPALQSTLFLHFLLGSDLLLTGGLLHTLVNLFSSPTLKIWITRPSASVIYNSYCSSYVL